MFLSDNKASELPRGSRSGADARSTIPCRVDLSYNFEIRVSKFHVML